MSRRKLIYDGIKVKVNGKVAFMEKILPFKAVQDLLAEKLAKDEVLREKFHCFSMRVEQGTLMRLQLTEEDLELLCDELAKRGYKNLEKEENPVVRLYGQPLLEGKKEIDLDITYLVLYAIVINEKCRRALEEITECSEYYGLWERSKYNNPHFESYVPVEYIWKLRLLTGLLEKLRGEEENGDSYKLFMRIVLTGNGYLKRQLKGRNYLSGECIRTIFDKEVAQSNNMFPVMCRMVLSMVIAEDLGIPVKWDYNLQVMVHFFQSWQDELANLDGDEQEEAKTSEEEYLDFLKRFDEEYHFHGSLTNLAICSSEEENPMGELLFDVMGLFEVNPRKFEGSGLTEKECRQLWKTSDRWSLKKYWYMQVIAQLCKYIHDLEGKYLYISKDSQDLQDWKKEQAQFESINQQRKYQSEIERLSAEKKHLEEAVLQQEQQISKQQKLYEEQKVRLRQNMHELAALRSYVHSVREDGEELPQDATGKMEAWKDKKVLVVGGHINWQNKLKEIFPKWQFVAAGQKTVDNDIIKGKDCIVCNTEILSHSCYYKVIAAKDKEQRLFYVHNNNVQRCIMELEGQMK